MPPAGSAAADQERHICCTLTSVLLHLVQDAGGAAAVTRLLAEADTSHDAAFLSHPDNWVSVDEAMSLLGTAQALTGDPLLARRVGEHAVGQHAGTQVATLLRSLGSPEAILSNIAQAAGKFSTVTAMKTVSSEPGRAVVSAQARNGIPRHPLHCQWTAGLISQSTVLFGLPPATVTESECQAAGGDRCTYTLSWDAEQAAQAADPAQRVTALEAQLVAVSERLRGVYKTASDLLSPDDLDVVLARIVDRAASTVRAPRYVLAVRPTPGAELRTYCDGVSEAEAGEIARATVDRGEDVGDFGVVARVESSRRYYGSLIALNVEGTRFFAQERELLGLYATHAAAVLDMATALEESARRHRDVTGLLSLSQALAQATTSDDVAARLVEAVPRVLDCDHLSVHLWDEEDRRLRPVAGTSHGPGAKVVGARALGGPDSALVARLRKDTSPQFFDPGSAESVISAVAAEHGLCHIALVPIVARSAFLGALLVGVKDDPRRLAESPELVDRLTGLAALVAPSIQSGRLIYELRHQAAHDPLTGVPNRAGFAERIRDTVAAADEGPATVALLFVDLDNFKQINDDHGHHSGDEILRQTAQRLAEVVRSRDATARLGGDEFAVILTDVGSAAELEAAAARLRDAFDRPFWVDGGALAMSASVGGAIWPSDGTGIDALIRSADLAMYRDKVRETAR